uniref:Uncharacterized protein n=1 Tax=Pyxicephalus adspersus TaxID=30357 RepID=A0AAV3AIM5_PYXAD|nr:TPA: hypothetical protein GDO54_011380 [Pyxicephalus adspersus]
MMPELDHSIDTTHHPEPAIRTGDMVHSSGRCAPPNGITSWGPLVSVLLRPSCQRAAVTYRGLGTPAIRDSVLYLGEKLLLKDRKCIITIT